MKYFNNPLLCLAVLVLVASVPLVVIHSFGDNNGDNLTQNEEHQSPAIQSNLSPVQTDTPTEGAASTSVSGDTNSGSTRSKGMDAGNTSCDEEGARKAGWKVLSCDPLRLMSLEEWSAKSSNPHFRYRPELYCFDESNFAGIFHEVEPTDFPDPNWLSEVKLDNGCSFFFHPNQGVGNGQQDERK